MASLGFSTGALAKGDFKRGIDLQSHAGVNAIELSALRETEVDALVSALSYLNLSGFSYVSFHAPSQLDRMSEEHLVARLQEVAQRNIPIVVHPDIIKNPSLWQSLGRWLLIENMDQRKSIGRTATELGFFFNVLPEARLCFDIAHARQVDPTMSASVELLVRFADRLAEIHLSEVNSKSNHIAISSTAAHAYRRVSSLIPKDVPVILESMIAPDQIDDELEMARCCFVQNGGKVGHARRLPARWPA